MNIENFGLQLYTIFHLYTIELEHTFYVKKNIYLTKVRNYSW